MYSKAFAPEYQGALGSLSVNAPLSEVLTHGIEQLEAARASGDARGAARCGLAVAEAQRRLGHVREAELSWKAGYRAARSVADAGMMAWAMWSGGTLARQCGRLRLAFRLLGLAAELADHGGDHLARGYALAGMAETGRIQGDYEAVAQLHEKLLAEARGRGEARHTVWALEGIAQMRRNTGDLDGALAMFREAAVIAEEADDRRGHAWALRGVADVLSARGEDPEHALVLLSEAEEACRTMKLAGALAYNHKMRANVYYRAGRYREARTYYEIAYEEFHRMRELRGEALARLGLVKARARLGRPVTDTAVELDSLAEELDHLGLRHARRMVDGACAELGVATGSAWTRPEAGTTRAA